MKLYPRRLRSIDDLEKERKLLRRELKELDSEELFSIEGITNGKDWKEVLMGGLGRLGEFLPISGPVLSILKRFAGRLFHHREKQKQKENNDDARQKDKHDNAFVSLAKEVAGSYLKWKAIELSYKGIKHLLKS